MPSWGSGQMSTSSAESTSLPAMKVSKEVSSRLALPAVKVQRSERDSGTRLRNSRIGKHSRRQPLGEISTLMRSSSALTSRRHQEAETGSRMAARRFSTSSASVTESNASSSSVACASSARPDLVRADPEGLFNRGLRETALADLDEEVDHLVVGPNARAGLEALEGRAPLAEPQVEEGSAEERLPAAFGPVVQTLEQRKRPFQVVLPGFASVGDRAGEFEGIERRELLLLDGLEAPDDFVEVAAQVKGAQVLEDGGSSGPVSRRPSSRGQRKGTSKE